VICAVKLPGVPFGTPGDEKTRRSDQKASASEQCGARQKPPAVQAPASTLVTVRALSAP
jgi:hypothetical protein